MAPAYCVGDHRRHGLYVSISSSHLPSEVRPDHLLAVAATVIGLGVVGAVLAVLHAVDLLMEFGYLV